MRLLIAGGRNLKPATADIDTAVGYLGVTPTLVISGGAKGVDRAGEAWAEARGIPVRQYLPDWTRYRRSAGVRRNAEMVRDCDVALVYWDGMSRGTGHTVELLGGSGKTYLIITRYL